MKPWLVFWAILVFIPLSLLYYSKYVKEKRRVEEASYLCGQLSVLEITGGIMIIERGTYSIRLEKLED